jgi:hypothetical protein
MSRGIKRLGLLVALLVLAFLVWRVFFPSPERIIRKNLNSVARLVSFAPNEGALAKLSNTQKLTGFCTGDVEVAIDVPGRVRQTLNGRDELMQAIMGARSTLSAMKVEFLDIGVTMGDDKESAVARLTAKADLPGEKIPEVQELKIIFQKVGRDWLIHRAETVKTLR